MSSLAAIALVNVVLEVAYFVKHWGEREAWARRHMSFALPPPRPGWLPEYDCYTTLPHIDGNTKPHSQCLPAGKESILFALKQCITSYKQ